MPKLRLSQSTHLKPAHDCLWILMCPANAALVASLTCWIINTHLPILHPCRATCSLHPTDNKIKKLKNVHVQHLFFAYGVLELPWNFIFFNGVGGGARSRGHGPTLRIGNVGGGCPESPRDLLLYPQLGATLTVRLGATLTVRLGATAGRHVDVASSVQTVGQRRCREELRLVKLPQLECKTWLN